MKKVCAFIASILFIINMFAQNPTVAISVDEVTACSYTCTFTPNSACDHYVFMAGYEGELDSWLPFMQTYEAMIDMWGISCVGDTTHTWTDQAPNTTYIVYVLAIGADTVVYTDTLRTLSLGGDGTSVITLSVSDIGDTCVTTTAVPNDQTSMFKDMIVTRNLFEEEGEAGIIAWLQENLLNHYETDVWCWLTLEPSTDYYFVAIGMNANEEWGELATLPFSTTPTVGIQAPTTPTFDVYPNPASDFVCISGLNRMDVVTLFDMQGRVMQKSIAEADACVLSLKALSTGVYFVAVQNEKASFPVVKKILVERK